MNQKDLIKYALIALGAYLIYEYIQKNGGLSGIFGTTAAAGGTGTGLTSNGVAALNAMLNLESVASFNAAQITQLALTPAQVSMLNAATVPGDRVSADALMHQLGISASQLAFIRSTNISPVGGGTQTVAVPTHTGPTQTMKPITPAQIVSLLQIPCNGTPAWIDTKTQEGRIIGFDSSDAQVRAAVTCIGATPVNPPAPPPPVPISQQMLNAAGTNSLNMDQWAFYYTQLTGKPSPVDPGSIDPSVYAGAGIVDRTTPTDVGTWLAIMQNQAPQLGLMGLGAMRYTPAWLM